ncbi:MAG: response regulator [Epsilonproteobacteria bacterium]|nr:response regulator [Campylobacterota bacterium]
MDTQSLKERLNRAAEEIRGSDDNIAINRIVEGIITDLMETEYASVWINDYPRLVRERESGVREISLEEKRGLLYKSYITRQSAIYNYITSEKGYVPEIDNPDNIRIKSKIAIPLMHKKELVGIVTCYSSVKKVKNFSRKDLEIFHSVTPFVIDAVCKMMANMGKEPLKKGSDGQCHCLLHTGERVAKKVEHIEEIDHRKEDQNELLAMTSQIVHDIRTPANNLTGFLELLEEQIEDKRLKEYVGYAKSSAALINQLTTSILDTFSAKLAGEEESRRERVALPHFFAEIAHIFSANMAQKGIGYHIYLDPLLPEEAALETVKFKRVVMNLLSNALKFTPEGGDIHFSVRYLQEQQRIVVSVKDSGIGIPAEKQKEIFKPFVQAEADTKARFGGTGLGLTICAEYVRQMGGELKLESEPEKGSEFFFEMPLEGFAPREPFGLNYAYVTILMDKEDVQVADTVARYLVRMGVSPDRIKGVQSLSDVSAETTHLILMQNRLSRETFAYARDNEMPLMIVEQSFLSLDAEAYEGAILVSQYEFYGKALADFVARQQPKRVLIVEDDRISIALLQNILKEEFCEVDVAHDGLEGFFLLKEALFAGRPYDVLYTDMQMPGLTGVEMLRDYRELEREENVRRPVKAVSISGDPDKAEKELFDFIAGKPFRKEEIKAILRQAN